MTPSTTLPIVDNLIFLRAALGYLLGGRFRLPRGHIPRGDSRISDTISGICVASMEDPASDTLMVKYLRQLNICVVKLDYGYEGPGGHQERFLNRLLDEQFRVLLRLVPPVEEARRMDTDPARDRWRDFVADTLDRHGPRIEGVEIGNTVNRRRWSGFVSLRHFMGAWDVAHDLARERGVLVAGPNVTDFEPLYNAGLLAVMARRRRLPDVHTDNLFVERALEPELFDRKVIGRRLGPLHKLNLVKKSRLLTRLGQRYGVARTWSTSAFWSLKRLHRRLAEGEAQQADYVSRYMLLAAAGELERAYWGPLVSQREGLVDDSTGREAPHELVNYFGAIEGRLDDYRIRPAFHAFACFNRLIPGGFYRGKCNAAEQLQIHEYENGGHRIHVLWTVNTRAAELAAIYPREDLAAAEFIDRDGRRLDEPPSLVTESPLYLRWPRGHTATADRRADVLPGVRIDGNQPGGRYYLHRDDHWLGLVFAASREEADRLIHDLHPSRITPSSEISTLRKSRNVIWTLEDPRRPDRLLAAKKPHRLRWNKRINDHFKTPKALRSWNNAWQLLRYGIDSPRPVACFYRADGVDVLNNWYICEYAGKVPSVRDFFTAYTAGAAAHLGISRQQFFPALIEFLLRLHDRGCYFRDLTGGNILVNLAPDGGIRFSLIDTGRARFYPKYMPWHKRLADLTRTCYKLNWHLRREFMEMYLEARKRRFGWRSRLPFVLFDLKMDCKAILKGKPRPSTARKQRAY